MGEQSVTFTTTLHATGNNVGIVVPDEVLARLDRGKRVPVVVTVDGGHRYRSTTATMGGRSMISFNAETRAATGRGGGDEVEIRLDVDDAPRTVEPPAALAARFAETPALAEAWAKLSPSKQKAHALAVEGAKTDATRERRVEKVVAELS